MIDTKAILRNKYPEANPKSESDERTVCYGRIDFSSKTGISGTSTIPSKTEKAAASLLNAFHSGKREFKLSDNLLIEQSELKKVIHCEY